MEALDHYEITALVARLGHWLDDRRFDAEGLRAVYTEDVVAESPRGNPKGLQEVLEHVRRTGPEDERTQHHGTQVLIDLDGDRADVTTSQLVHFFREGEPPHRTVGLRQSYTAVRTPDGWRFASTTVRPLWSRTD